MIPWRHYARLVRLPNLPSALADITLAALATGLLVARWPVFLLLLCASACLYLAGMAFNDYFDVEQDRHERPDRPIPSGAVSPRHALILATGLLGFGVFFAWAAGFVLQLLAANSRVWLCGTIAGFLGLAILLYDSWLKHTPLGPLGMGLCRFLNILLGFSLAGTLEQDWPLGPHLACTVGLYIVGVTWLARSEARTTSRPALVGAVIVLFAAFCLALALPAYRPADTASFLFPYFLVAVGFFIGLPLRDALVDPTPIRVQAAVKRCLIGLILFDTSLSLGATGTVALVILVLMIPSVYLNRKRWLYAT